MNIGIIGAGQLGRMMALSGYPLGMSFTFLDPTQHPPAAPLGTLIKAPYDDKKALTLLSSVSDVITYEFENVPSSSVEYLSKNGIIHPNQRALATAQDRVPEKRFFNSVKIPTARFFPCSTKQEVQSYLKILGYPAVLKTRKMGYDGKGQILIRKESDLRAASSLFGQPLILEEFVPFSREVSIICLRSRTGAIACYPLTENIHREGILRESRVIREKTLQRQADRYASLVLKKLDYCGVLAIEFFVKGTSLIANEMAPRVHNSGHWTIDGAHTSQFENHLRAIAGLPLGNTSPKGHAAMVNIIGKLPPTRKVLSIPGAKLHLYGKEERAKRKLGHINVVASSVAERERAIAAINVVLG